MQKAPRALVFSGVSAATCLLLTGCSTPPSVIVNDLGADVHDEIAFQNDACVKSSGVIPVHQNLFVDCKLSTVTHFRYSISAGVTCNVSEEEFRNKVHIVQDENIYHDTHEEVRLSSLKCS